MSSIGEQLRHARESLGRSLDEIAATTRINRKFLEDIERGAYSTLPQTYIRAFIRAYANEVNLDAQLLLKDFEATGEQNITQETNNIPDTADIRSDHRSRVNEETHSISAVRTGGKQSKVLFVFSILLLAGLAISLYWMHQQHTPQPVHEIVFQDVMKEWEAKNNQSFHPDTSRSDSVNKSAHADSLSLLGIATDTVWVRVIVDKSAPRKLTLKPKQRLMLKAKDKFTISMGNAGAVVFTLNGKSVGALGKQGEPVENITLGRETIARLQKKSSHEQ